MFNMQLAADGRYVCKPDAQCKGSGAPGAVHCVESLIQADRVFAGSLEQILLTSVIIVGAHTATIALSESLGAGNQSWMGEYVV